MKRIILFSVLLALITASCQGSTNAQPPEAGIASQGTNESKSPATAESSTPTNIPSTPTQENKEAASVPAGCTVISPRPTPGPTEQSIFPPVTENDWVYGSEKAGITITEYSDFQ